MVLRQTVPASLGMTELWCQAGLSPSHQQHGLWKWGLLWFSLSNLRKLLASEHQLRLSHLGSLARVKQQIPAPYQATPILTPAPNRGKQELLKELSLIRQHDQTVFDRLLLRKAWDVWLNIFKQIIPEAHTWWGLFAAKQLEFGKPFNQLKMQSSNSLAIVPPGSYASPTSHFLDHLIKQWRILRGCFFH